MEEKKISSLGYEDLSKDIELEIFGLKFGIGLNEEYIKKLRNVEYKDENSVKDMIDTLLGTGSFEKIRDKFYKDQGKEIDEFVWVKVVLFIKQEFEKFSNRYGDNFKVTQRRPVNREQRRYDRYRNNYNRGYNSRRFRRY